MTVTDTPDVEGIMLRLLTGMGAQASTKVPRNRPAEFVKISVTGGGGDVLLDTPTLLVECWGPDTVTASRLARQVRQRLHESRFDVVDGWQVYGIDCAYPVYFPDETSDRYQFLATTRLRRHN